MFGLSSLGLYGGRRRSDRALPAAQLLGPDAVRQPLFPTGWDYVLFVPRDEHGAARLPVVFLGLGVMANSIHLRREGHGLQLQDAKMHMRGENEARDGVSIWLLDPESGDRRACLGWAYVNGASRVTLEGALREAKPGFLQ
jgi:hypothetical protein